jgi:hypothetical protein
MVVTPLLWPAETKALRALRRTAVDFHILRRTGAPVPLAARGHAQEAEVYDVDPSFPV